MGKSSKDKRDSYYRLAKEQGWRARSAFKLLQLDAAFNLLPRDAPARVIDLCAAPGSWSQVLARTLAAGSTIIALDLQPMTPLPHVLTLQADITHPSTLPLVLSHLRNSSPSSSATSSSTTQAPAAPSSSASPPPPAPADVKADLVVCDGAPDVTGLHDLDEYVQASLLLAALNLAVCVLRADGRGVFVAKIFRGRDAEVLFAQLRTLFRRVTCAKPRSSRASSVEAFVVCEGYDPPPGFEPSLEKPLGLGTAFPVRAKEGGEKEKEGEGLVEGVREIVLEEEGQRGTGGEEGQARRNWAVEGEDVVRYIAPFIACGDLSAYDSDATYRLPDVDADGNKRRVLDPVQPPTAPPYKTALEMRRQVGRGVGAVR